MSNNEYMAVYMLSRYYERIAIAYAILGGMCARCGVQENLQVDHRIRELKDQRLPWNTCSWVRFWKELEICQLLCEECHKGKTRKEMSNDRNRIINKTCDCGKTFERDAQYLGHRSWCLAPEAPVTQLDSITGFYPVS